MDYIFHNRFILGNAQSKQILMVLEWIHEFSESFRKNFLNLNEMRTKQNRKSNGLLTKRWNFSRISISKPTVLHYGLRCIAYEMMLFFFQNVNLNQNEILPLSSKASVMAKKNQF